MGMGFHAPSQEFEIPLRKEFQVVNDIDSFLELGPQCGNQTGNDLRLFLRMMASGGKGQLMSRKMLCVSFIPHINKLVGDSLDSFHLMRPCHSPDQWL